MYNLCLACWYALQLCCGSIVSCAPTLCSMCSKEGSAKMSRACSACLSSVMCMMSYSCAAQPLQSPAAGGTETSQRKITPLMQFLHDKHALKPEKKAAILVPIKKVCHFCPTLMHLVSTNMFPATCQTSAVYRRPAIAACATQTD